MIIDSLIRKSKQLWAQYIHGNIMVTRFAKVFSVDVVVRGGNYILIPVFLHLMTQQEIGIYDYMFQFACLIAPVLGLGVYVSMIKMYNNYPDKQERGKLLFTLHTTIFVFLFVSAGIIYAMKWDYQLSKFLMVDNIAYGRCRFFILIAIVWCIYNTFLTQFFVISENIAKIQRYNIGRFLLVNILVLASLFLCKGDRIEIRFACTYIVEMIVMLYFFRHYAKEMVCRFDKKMFLQILKIALPTVLTFITVLLLDFSDKYFVQKYVGINTFAVYNKAAQFAMIISVIFGSVWQIYQPFLFKERNVQTLQRKNNRLAKTASILFLGLSICIWAGIWIALQCNIIPATYYEMIYVLPIILLTRIIVVLLMIYQATMLYFDKMHIMLVSAVFFSILTIVANYFAVQYYSYYGAAVTLLGIYILWTLFYYFRARHYIRNRIKTNNLQ
jgi:O-antigen/teichoic acid export membrane protein